MALADHNGNLVYAYEMSEASGNAIAEIGALDLTDNNTVTSSGGQRHFASASSEYFDHADASILSIGNEDVCGACWFKADSFPGGNNGIVAKWPGGANGREYTVTYDGTRMAFTVRYADETANGLIQANTFGAVSTGTLYSLIWWHDWTNSKIGIAVNAVADETAHSAGVYDGANSFRVGSWEGGNMWDGNIGPLYCWKGYILSSADRTEFHNSGTIFRYPFSSVATKVPWDVPHSPQHQAVVAM